MIKTINSKTTGLHSINPLSTIQTLNESTKTYQHNYKIYLLRENFENKRIIFVFRIKV